MHPLQNYTGTSWLAHAGRYFFDDLLHRAQLAAGLSAASVAAVAVVTWLAVSGRVPKAHGIGWGDHDGVHDDD